MPMSAPTFAPRPRVVCSTTYRAPTLLGTAYITVTDDDTGAPLEAFVNVGKAGSDTFAVAEAMGRLVSFILRTPSALSRRERAEQIVAQLSRVGGVLSEAKNLPTRALPDALAAALAEHIRLTDADTPTDALAIARFASRRVPEPRTPIAAPSRVAPKPAARAEKLGFLNLSRANENKGASSVKELRPEVKQAAQVLGDALKNTSLLHAYEEAAAKMATDTRATALLDELERVQADFRVRQSNGGISQADIARLRQLQNDVQTNPTIAAFIEAQQVATAFFPEVNQEISQLLGIDFASLAAPASC